VTATVTGNVNVSNTPSVNVTNSPNINIANTPSVALAGTPSVNVASLPPVTLSGTPTVSISGGSISATRASASDSEIVNELGLSPGSSGTYNFTREGFASTTFPSSEGNVGLDTTTLVTSTANDIDNIDLFFCKDTQCNNQGQLILGRVAGGGFSMLLFNQPIRFSKIAVSNPAILTSATFTISFLGDNLQ
jgi:hypothetical protein